MIVPIIATSTLSQVYPFDARGIGKRFRHAAIFGALDALNPGETMRFVNDHNPLPLLAQLQERYGDALLIEYRARKTGCVMIDFTVAAGVADDESCSAAAVAADAGASNAWCA